VVTEYSYYGVDVPHAVIKQQPTTKRLYARLDGLGNVLALTDTSGSIRTSYGYDDWGKLTSSSDQESFNGTDRARWKGALWLGPEVDLYSMRARWYEPHSGRFLSEDPIGLAGGINPVLFAGNDPVNGADPSGLDCTITGYYWWHPLVGIISIRITSVTCTGSAGSKRFAGELMKEVGGGASGPGWAIPVHWRGEPVEDWEELGLEAERACARAVGFAPAIITADAYGVRALWNFVKTGVRFGIAFVTREAARRGFVQRSATEGLILTHDVAAGRTATRAAAFETISPGSEAVQLGGTVSGGLMPESPLEFAASFVPGVSTGQTLAGVYQECFNPGG
jgi:RHS repeat-associated protein